MSTKTVWIVWGYPDRDGTSDRETEFEGVYTDEDVAHKIAAKIAERNDCSSSVCPTPLDEEIPDDGVTKWPGAYYVEADNIQYDGRAYVLCEGCDGGRLVKPNICAGCKGSGRVYLDAGVGR